MTGSPPPPNFNAAAEKTAASGRPDYSTPFGGGSWDAAHQHFTQSLAPGLQGGLNTLMGQLGGSLGTPLNGDAARAQGEKAIYEKEMGQLNPMFANQRDASRTHLLNSGYSEGDPTFRGAMADQQAQQGSAMNDARLASILGGGQYAQQAMNMQQQGREAPLKELLSMMGFMHQPETGQGANYLGAAQAQNGADMAKYNSDQKFWSDLIGGGLGLAGGIASGGLTSLLGLGGGGGGGGMVQAPQMSGLYNDGRSY